MATLSLIRAYTAAAICALLTASAAGQEASQPYRQADPAARRMVANQLTYLALDALAARTGPAGPAGDAGMQPHQLARADGLLDMALQLGGDDAELWRLDAEMERLRGDREAARDSLKQYLRLRPDDDAAKLELIMDSLSRIETVDGRLERVEALLNSGVGQRLSKPLRSRLAMYASSAAGELAQDKRRVTWLVRAADWDPGNADAARQVLAELVSREAEVRKLAGASVNLVRAAPLDAGARLQLAALLANEAVYDRAIGQYDLAQRLAGQPLPPGAYRSWAMSLLTDGEPAEALRLLEGVERLETQPEEEGGEPKPVPTDLLVLRLVALDAAGQQMDEVERTWRALASRLLGDDRRKAADPAADAASDERGASRLSQGAVDFALLAAVLDREDDATRRAMDAAAADDPRVEAARGWRALRANKLDEARVWFEGAAQDEPLAALGLAAMSGVDAAGRARALREVVRDRPQSLAAALAARRLRDDRRTPQPTDIGQAIETFMDRQSPRLWALDIDVAQWLELRVDTPSAELAYLEPLRLEASLRNVGPVPLTLGPGGTATGRLWASMTPATSGQDLPPLPPVVVDAARRLVLDPGERLKVEVRLDRSPLGTLMTSRPLQGLAVEVEAAVDPRPTATGLASGPLSVKQSAGTVRMAGEALTRPNAEAWLKATRTGQGADRLRAAAKLLQMRGSAASELITPDLEDQAATAVAALADTGPVGLAWVVRFMPGGPVAGPLREAVDAAERMDDPLPAMMLLATRVKSVNDPALNAALRSENATIKAFGEAVRDSLRPAAGE